MIAFATAERLSRDLDQRATALAAGVALSALRRLEAGRGSTLSTTFAVLGSLGLTTQVDGTEDAPRRRRGRPLPAAPVGLDRREERSSWYLHRAVAAKLRTGDGRAVLARARTNLPTLRANVRGPQAHAWLDTWEGALDGPLPDLVELMLRTDEEGIDLRQVSPFAGALTQDERMSAIRLAAA